MIVVSPTIDGRYQHGRFLELLNYALNPANEFVMEELFNAGFESGELAFARALQEIVCVAVGTLILEPGKHG